MNAKRFQKTLIGILLCLCLLIGCLPAVAATPFTDVKKNAYYAEAVEWAVAGNITAGVSPTTFAPDASCTRGQIVSFLWRNASCPEPKTSANPFTDIKKGAYYYKAVLWAVENGITAGATPTTFAPDAPCTRGQIVAFLWRSASCPTPPTSGNPFTDVKKSAYYYKAVLWAVEQAITAGTTATTFSPEAPCTRGQIVTFLYRYMNPLDILVNPTDHFMTSSMETASFTVTVTGGIAPYTYRWYVSYDDETVPQNSFTTRDTHHTLNVTVSDYDFDEYNAIYVYCVITDAAGKQVRSNFADVVPYVSMRITAQPANYNMASSMETANFTVQLTGGTAPYTYKWYASYDGREELKKSELSMLPTNFADISFSDYDFDDYNVIYVYCAITDAAGHTVNTNNAYVYPH